jgi:hypothetical protein
VEIPAPEYSLLAGIASFGQGFIEISIEKIED